MEQVVVHEPQKLEPSCIGNWLKSGWQDFTNANLVSIAYAAAYCIVGGAGLIYLMKAGMGLLFFILAGGFMFFVPVLITGYYRVSQILAEGGAPRFDDVVQSFIHNPPAVWGIGLISALMYLFWVADALVIYTAYFELGNKVGFSELLANPGIRGNLIAFLLFSSVVGSILAFIMYLITVFAVPFAFEQRGGLVEAMSFSARAVFANFQVAMVWAAILAVGTLGTLLVAMPLILVVFPILSYAGFAAYRDVIRGQ